MKSLPDLFRAISAWETYLTTVPGALPQAIASRAIRRLIFKHQRPDMRNNYDFSRGIKNSYKSPPLATAYFDRNVFGDICELRGGVTADDVGVVQQAVRSGALTIPASITLF